MGKVEIWEFEQRCEFSLDLKVQLTNTRIRDWYEHYNGQVYVSFSGGKDSTVLLHMVRQLYPNVPAVFVDTGLEYPEIRDFVKTIDNVVWLKPKMSFRAVIEKYGFPVISKEQSCAIGRYRNTKDPVQRYLRLNGWPKGKRGMVSKKWQFLIQAPFKISDACCDVMKKRPLDQYVKDSGKHPMTAMMASESRGRKMQYLANGCNAFDNKKPISWPMAFWTDKDVWGYLKKYDMSYSEIYTIGEKRTGCMFCMFGIHLEKGENRFQRMKLSHPAQYKYCIEKLGCGEVLDFIGVEY